MPQADAIDQRTMPAHTPGKPRTLDRWTPRDATPADSTRLSDEEKRSLIADLCARQVLEGVRERRAVSRVPLVAGTKLTVDFHHPGGTVISLAVAPRDISAGGVGFLHGAFVHTGTLCRMRIQDGSGCTTYAHGHVVRCEHLRGRVHLVGVRFENELSIDALLGAAGDANARMYATIGTLEERLAMLVRTRASAAEIAQVAVAIARACGRDEPTETG